MAQPYSQDLRDRVLVACGRAMKTKQVAELFAVSASWVRRVKQRLREHGEVSPRACTPTARFIKIDRVKLRELVETHPDATLVELRQLLGVRCAESSIWRALNRMGYSFKKDDSRGRAGSTGCRPAAHDVAAPADPTRRRPPDLH